MILVSSAGIKPKKTFRQRLIFVLAKFGNKFSFLPGYSLLQKIFYKFIVRRKDYLKTKGIMKEIFKKIIDEDLTLFLPQITIPTLLVWGAKDRMTPLSDGYKMNKEIKNSELKIIPNVSHAPHLEAPEKLAEIIMKKISYKLR
jgi:pimeloyl-ACP methyl ester carboxylesterase